MVEIGDNQNVKPIMMHGKNQKRFEYKPGINRLTFAQQFVYVKVITGKKNTVIVQIRAKFPKQDDYDKHEADLAEKRAADPEYDKKQLENHLRKNPKAMVKHKLDSLMTDANKFNKFMAEIQEIKKQKALQCEQ